MSSFTRIPSMFSIILLLALSATASTAEAQQVSASGSGPTRAYACVEANSRMASIAHAGNKRIYRHDGCSCTKSEMENGGTYRFQCKASGMMDSGTGGKMISATGAASSEQAACATAKSSAQSIARAGGLQFALIGGCSCEDTPVPSYTSSSKTCMFEVFAEPK